MGLTTLRIAMIIGVMLVITALAFEIRKWGNGGYAVTRKQKSYRIISAIILISILAMIFAGDEWIKPYGLLFVISYWMSTFALALFLLLLVMFDLKEVGIRYSEEKKSIVRNITRHSEDRPDE